MAVVNLDELIALNREIGALAAAGLPLGAGLRRVADEFTGPASGLPRRLSERIEAGADLAAALEAEGDRLPSAYRAIVRAGLRSGRLPAALEGYADTATRVAELRRVTGLAVLYPLIVFLVAWILYVFACSTLLPNYDWLELGDRMWVQPLRLEGLEQGRTGALLITVLVPAVVVIGVGLWWWKSASSVEAGVPVRSKWLGWIPGVRRTRRLSCEAAFAELLGLFVENRVPMVEALPLAAEASGLSVVDAGARRVAGELASGERLRTSSESFRELPSLVRLALLADRGPDPIAAGLRRAGARYRERAENWAHALAIYIPVSATVLLGGVTVAVYAVLLLQPYAATLRDVTQWY